MLVTTVMVTVFAVFIIKIVIAVLMLHHAPAIIVTTEFLRELIQFSFTSCHCGMLWYHGLADNQLPLLQIVKIQLYFTGLV